MRSLRVSGLYGVFLCFAGCGPSPAEVSADHDETESATNPLFVHSNLIWDDTRIPVCWETANFATEKAWAIEALQAQWIGKSGVAFTGFQACPSPTTFFPGVRVEWAAMFGQSGFGKEVRGVVNGMRLDTWRSIANPAPCAEGAVVPFTHQECITSTAVHEFGHAMGFTHEWIRSDTPSSCTLTKDTPPGDVMIGDWDGPSVMNDCDVNHSVGRGILSQLDIIGARRFYGQPDRDVNDDGNIDVLWHNPASGTLAAWNTNGQLSVPASTTASIVSSGNWKPVGSGDFNYDGRLDVLWHDPIGGGLAVWLMNGSMTVSGTPSITGGPLVPESSGWKVVSTGDMNADGKTDIVWYNSTTGKLSFWMLNGTAFAMNIEPSFTASGGWTPIGTGDFNQDGLADVAWFHPTNRQIAVWILDLNSVVTTSFVIPNQASSGWVAKSVIDVDHNGKSDVLWMHQTTRQVAYWSLSGSTVPSSGTFALVPATGWNMLP